MMVAFNTMGGTPLVFCFKKAASSTPGIISDDNFGVSQYHATWLWLSKEALAFISSDVVLDKTHTTIYMKDVGVGSLAKTDDSVNNNDKVELAL